jgi:hypothetical protein
VEDFDFQPMENKYLRLGFGRAGNLLEIIYKAMRINNMTYSMMGRNRIIPIAME